MNIFRGNLLLKTFAEKMGKIGRHWLLPVFYISASYISLLYFLVILDILNPVDQNCGYLLLPV